MRWRRTLPRRRLARVRGIVAHRGDYERYSYGSRDIVRDLLQPNRVEGLR